MSLVTGSGVGRYFGAQDVFSDLAFSIEHGDRVGLVGANGEGKTTLLRLLAGLDQPTSGTLHFKRDLTLGYLPQDPVDDTSDTPLWDYALEAFDRVRQLEAELAQMARHLEDPQARDEHLERYSALQAEFERCDGYTYEHRTRTVLHGLGFTSAQYGQPLSQLSGGQHTRALLAHMLLEDADLLLLDEPTNYLDLAAVEWLESWLRDFSGALLVVSHDRYFLDAVAGRIWEISFGGLETYRGNYTAYVRQRDERRERRLKEWQTQQEHIAKTEDYIQRYIYGQRTKEAQGRRTRLQRLLKNGTVEKPREHGRLHVRLGPTERSGDIALRVRDLVVGYSPEQPILRIPELEVRRGQRLAVVGANGAGKTTLVRSILGELPPLAGDIRPGAKIEIGYLPQGHDYLDGSLSVLDAVQQMSPELKPGELRNFLGSFLFSDDDVFKRIDQLSGGERSRVALARLVLTGANLLVLDEPTNHLDITSQEVLESVLDEFDGTLILVSHDRYLIQALAQQVWLVEDGTVQCFPGNWEEFLAHQQEVPPPDTTDEEKVSRPTRQEEREEQRERRRQRKRLEQTQQRHQEVEERIGSLEARLQTLSEEIGKAGEAKDVERLNHLVNVYQELQGKMKDLWAEWEQLGLVLESADTDTPSTEQA